MVKSTSGVSDGGGWRRMGAEAMAKGLVDPRRVCECGRMARGHAATVSAGEWPGETQRLRSFGMHGNVLL